jgi:hypothetical protein
MTVNSDPDIIVVIEVKDGYRGLCFRSGNIFDPIHSANNIVPEPLIPLKTIVVMTIFALTASAPLNLQIYRFDHVNIFLK